MVEACETVSGFGTSFAAIHAQDHIVLAISECKPHSYEYLNQALTLVDVRLPLLNVTIVCLVSGHVKEFGWSRRHPRYGANEPGVA